MGFNSGFKGLKFNTDQEVRQTHKNSNYLNIKSSVS